MKRVIKKPIAIIATFTNLVSGLLFVQEPVLNILHPEIQIAHLLFSSVSKQPCEVVIVLALQVELLNVYPAVQIEQIGVDCVSVAAQFGSIPELTEHFFLSDDRV